MDVENVNCKLHVSQCTDMEILPIEKPLKIDCEINGLQHLVTKLHEAFSNDHVNVQDVQKLMSAYKSDPKDWKRYAKFDRYRYTRNLVDSGNGAFNIMILCWGPGHASAIHDHADSHCFMKILSGNLEEVRYDWPKNVQPEVLKKLRENTQDSNNNAFDNCQTGNDKQNGDVITEIDDETGYSVESMVEIGRTRMEVNDVCYINDALGLHRMENPSHVDGAVSLHLYCPPFDSCRVFDARTGRPTKVTVTFTSVNGKRMNKINEVSNVADIDSQ